MPLTSARPCLRPVQPLYLVYQSLVRNQRLAAIDHFFVTDDALLIDDKVRPLCQTAGRFEHSVSFDCFCVGIIADQREIQLQVIYECFLRKDRIRTDPDDLRIDLFEFVIVVPTGRQFLDSGCGEIENVELDQNVFDSVKAAQLELPSLSTRELEIGSFVADLECQKVRGEDKQE